MGQLVEPTAAHRHSKLRAVHRRVLPEPPDERQELPVVGAPTLDDASDAVLDPMWQRVWMRARHCGSSASERWDQAIAQQHNTGTGTTTGRSLMVDAGRATRRR